MRVLKFGGSSVATLEAMERSAAIVKEAQGHGRVGVVVSALRGITDDLLSAVKTMPTAPEASVDACAAGFVERHLAILRELFEGAVRTAAEARINEIGSLLRRLLHGARVVGSCPPPASDQIVGLGETAAVAVFHAVLRSKGVDAISVEAAENIVTDENFGQARIIYDTTFERLDKLRESSHRVLLIAGFIGRSAAGRMTTLGRNGSDHTAAVLSRALGADVCEIWTDSDGVYTADPRLLPEAYVLSEISYTEAMEMVRIGKKIVHPLTFVPVMEAGIPVRVRNTFNAEAPGTWIRQSAPPPIRGVRGLTVADGLALVNVQGAGMTGTPGAASYVFSVLSTRGINISFIAMSGSERSLTFAVADADADRAKEALEANLKEEQKARFIQSIDCRRNLAVLGAVGDDMRGHPGIAGRFFSALADAGINVVAIAQGSLEANISCVIESTLVRTALAAVHAAFLTPLHPPT